MLYKICNGDLETCTMWFTKRGDAKNVYNVTSSTYIIILQLFDMKSTSDHWYIEHIS